MATGTIARPGTKQGPCRRCSHKDCAEMRILAQEDCRLCGFPIGYETPFYQSSGGPAHAACAEAEL